MSLEECNVKTDWRRIILACFILAKIPNLLPKKSGQFVQSRQKVLSATGLF